MYDLETRGCGRGKGFGRRGFFEDNFFEDIDSIFKELEKSSYSSYQENFPPMDVSLDDKTGTLELNFALAGYSDKDINISAEGDVIKISGKKEKGEKTYIKKGIRERSFEVKYQLPAGKFNLTKSKASLTNGLLTINVPSSEKNKATKIEVQ